MGYNNNYIKTIPVQCRYTSWCAAIFFSLRFFVESSAIFFMKRFSEIHEKFNFQILGAINRLV